MDTDSFVININTEDFYKDIAGDIERWFDTFYYDGKDNRPFHSYTTKRKLKKHERICRNHDFCDPKMQRY